MHPRFIRSSLGCPSLSILLLYLALLFFTANSGTAAHHDTSFGEADATLHYQQLLCASPGRALFLPLSLKGALTQVQDTPFSSAAAIWLLAVQAYCLLLLFMLLESSVYFSKSAFLNGMCGCVCVQIQLVLHRPKQKNPKKTNGMELGLIMLVQHYQRNINGFIYQLYRISYYKMHGGKHSLSHHHSNLSLILLISLKML